MMHKDLDIGVTSPPLSMLISAHNRYLGQIRVFFSGLFAPDAAIVWADRKDLNLGEEEEKNLAWRAPFTAPNLI